jgi:sulfate adenylyltransferase large subunit
MAASSEIAATLPAPSTIEAFLEQEEAKQLLRFTTAGSVDDGKSTLIGRLLYDSKGVYEDQIASVRKASVNRSAGPIDFSLLTDGLRAEREQGITIDVAYRYFATPKRKFIIADTPGHEQYTRNMATGASTAHLAIVLVDARKGVLPQSRRHAFIASLLGIPYVVVAVNKMDLVEYSRDVFEKIERDFRQFARDLTIENFYFIPISALEGDNVVTSSPRTPWFQGPSLLEYLETVPVETDYAAKPLRFPVQYVVRPDLDFRGYAGQLASGTLRRGDSVMVLPSGRTSRVKSIPSFDGDLDEGFAPMSVTVCLEEEIDISRGDMLVTPAEMPHVSRRFEAMLVWMHADPMAVDKPYLIKHTSQHGAATVAALRHKIDINTLAKVDASELHLNEIGRVVVETHKPLFFDAYRHNRNTGSFILIDPLTNATVGAGMILERTAAESGSGKTPLSGIDFDRSRLTAAERAARSGHHPATIWMTARRPVAYMLERELFDRGCLVHVIADDVESHLLPELARMSGAAGLITICNTPSTEVADRDRAQNLVGENFFVEVDPQQLPADDLRAVAQISRILEDRGLIRKDDRGIGGDGI